MYLPHESVGPMSPIYNTVLAILERVDGVNKLVVVYIIVNVSLIL